MIVKIILLTIWIIVSLVEGKRDAHYFHDRNLSTSPDKQNIHWLFALERLVILSLISWVCFINYSVINSSVFIAGLVLVFSFFHNGIYYVVRHKLDNSVYKDGWWSSSKTSTAFFEFNELCRSILFMIGLALILYSTLF